MGAATRGWRQSALRCDGGPPGKVQCSWVNDSWTGCKRARVLSVCRCPLLACCLRWLCASSRTTASDHPTNPCWLSVAAY